MSCTFYSPVVSVLFLEKGVDINVEDFSAP